jgi:hypothetical protein
MPREQRNFEITRDKLFQLVKPTFAGGGGTGDSQPNPDEPLKPGPWDPVVRVALKEVLRFGPQPEPWRVERGAGSLRFGPSPEPWVSSLISSGLLEQIGRRFPAIFDVIGGGLRPGDLVALNPQPLPPRERFIVALADAVVARVEQMAETANAIDDQGDERGIIIVSGYVGRLVDEWCGTGYRPRWPFPGPPPWWFQQEVSARDILTLGASLHQASREAFHPVVGRALDEQADKLAQAGLERMG